MRAWNLEPFNKNDVINNTFRRKQSLQKSTAAVSTCTAQRRLRTRHNILRHVNSARLILFSTCRDISQLSSAGEERLHGSLDST